MVGTAEALDPLAVRLKRTVHLLAPLVVFAEQFKEIVADVKVKDLLDTNADGSRKNKRTDDTIVTEGDICR